VAQHAHLRPRDQPLVDCLLEHRRQLLSVLGRVHDLDDPVFTAHVMRCCEPGFPVAHVAIVTALTGVGLTTADVVSGRPAEAMGFTASSA